MKTHASYLQKSFIPFCFAIGAITPTLGSLEVVFEESNPNIVENLSRKLILLPGEFNVKVFNNGRVQCKFQMHNKSTWLRNKFRLKFKFSDLRTEFQENTREFRLVEGGTDLFKYSFHIPKEEADKVKKLLIIVESEEYHTNCLVNSCNNNRLTCGTVWFLIVLVTFFGIYYGTKKS